MTFLAEFEKVPFFTKSDLISVFPRSLDALNDRIKRALKTCKLLQLKNGLYMTSVFYFNEPDKIKLAEFMASQIRVPSYLSLEYVLQKYRLLQATYQDTHPLTSVTLKTGCLRNSFLGTFEYKNLKKSLYEGFEQVDFHGHAYCIATKAKALFDYFYLKPRLPRNLKNLKHFIFQGSGIQWQYFSRQDFEIFDKYVWKSNSPKMMKALRVMSEYFQEKDFQKWAGELLM